MIRLLLGPSSAAVGIALLLFVGCSTPVSYEDDWLDSPAVSDPSLSDPSVRVSTRPGLTEADRTKPVIIAAHGFTASTFEWEEFHEAAEANGNVLVSRVLLGGHGRTIDDFEESTWQDWGRPIIDEYEALVEQGYTSISLAGASAGGALILKQISDGEFTEEPPRHFFFIDPIVVPGDKNLTMVNVLGPLFGNVPQTENTEEEKRHWYTNRPTEMMAELYALCTRVRNELADGIRLPPGSATKVYQSMGDETADPVGALLIYKGLRTADGSRVDVEMIHSNLHVFTRLRGRAASEAGEPDRVRQRLAFDEMLARVQG